jgi:16S rRNA (uracil1498-N3)-methyltransferase
VRGHPFVVPATLGPRVLRAETAAIVGLALLQAA